ncbi:MAG: hypothetical protein HUJ26_01145 [Planctomycetaceae bacterium]|nr:hypothetical protein [Planctomycetaceae bacterium]
MKKSTPEQEAKPTDSEKSSDKQEQQDQEEPQTISEMLAQTKGYQKGDPLSWEIVSPILQKLREAGLQLPSDSELQKKFLKETAPFYQMMTTPAGRTFFKDLSRSPPAIDRAERYLNFPNGRKEMKFIMSRKGGAELFTDMVETRNGRSTARMLCSDSNSCDFTKPTGKIYLESQFVAFLKQSATDQKAASE